MEKFKRFILEHWEQMFFATVGILLLGFSFLLLWSNDVAGASATFAMAFFSFFYSNIARFKRFKGLGFEAELWDDKQKEAEQLIDRLKDVVSVYTREIVIGRVMQGRWGGGGKWRGHWDLYDELVERHSELGQEIDFSDLKRTLDSIFIFDIIGPFYETLHQSIVKAQAEAREVIKKEFGNPIKDADGYGKRNRQLHSIPDEIGNLFEISKQGDVAQHILDWARGAQCKFKDFFGIEVRLDKVAIEKLSKISQLYRSGPLEISDELVALADRE